DLGRLCDRHGADGDRGRRAGHGRPEPAGRGSADADDDGFPEGEHAMDASTNVLAEEVRAKRVAIDNDLELLRVRLKQADPRRMVDVRRWARTGTPIAAGIAGLWMLARQRRRVNSLDQLLLRELADLYRTERLLVPALERMSRKATDPELKSAFEAHRLETQGHVDR